MSKSKTTALMVMLTLFFFANSTIKAEPTHANTVNVSASFEFPNLDLSQSGYVFTRMQVVETLLNIDAQGNLLPGLATAWEILDDGKHWRLSLRDKVVFHNDNTLTADAVVNALKHAQQRTHSWQNTPIKSISASDPQHVDIYLHSPCQPFGALLAHYSSAILDRTAYNEQGNITQLIGTGPFSVHDMTPPYRLLVKKFPHYWGKKASIPYIRYTSGGRPETRMLQARSGRADITYDLDPIAIGTLQRQPTLNIIRSKVHRTLSIKLNAEHPYLSTVTTRQAMSLALDRQGIAIAILKTPQSATTQLLPPSMDDWHLPNTSTQPDIEKANALLAAQGWQRNTAGWLEKNGEIFEIDMLTYFFRPELNSVAMVIQDQWKRIGIKLNIKLFHYSAIPKAHADGSLETALITRNYGAIADPLSVLIEDFGSPEGSDWGSSNWLNSDVQSLLRSLVNEPDTTTYKRIAQQISLAIYEEKPVIPVSYYVQQTAVSKRLTGFRFDPYERSYHLNQLEWAN